MGSTFARCLDCQRLFGVEYDGSPPAGDALVCECGSRQFEKGSAEEVVPSREC